MSRLRITPCLLEKDQRLVKTIRFRDPKYVGDPVNAAKIRNKTEFDEQIVLDVDATVQGRDLGCKMFEYLAAERRMPLGYGDGVKRYFRNRWGKGQPECRYIVGYQQRDNECKIRNTVA